MLTPSNVTAAQFNSAIKGGEPSHVRLTFTGQNITLMDDDISANGGVSIRDYLNADTDLTIGVAVKKELTAYIFNSNSISSLDWEGEFKYEIGTEVNGSIEWITQGYFTGVRPERIYNVDVIQFVAYDRMNKFDILADDWLGNLTYPMTVRQMYDSLCLYCGVQNEVGDELSNIMSRSYAEAPIQNAGLTCRDILMLIAEAAGCYAKITASGKVKLVWYASANYTLTGDDEFSIDNVDLQSINLMAIDGLNVKQTEDDTGVIIQTGSRNTYLIVDNPFLTTDSSTEEDDYIQPIFDRLSGFGGYLPMNVVCIGNPLIEAGDIISVSIGNDTFSLPIFCKEESFNGALTDMYEATGNMKRQTYTQALKQKLSQGGRYHIFKNTIDTLYSELYDPTTGDVSILNQTAQALGLSAAGIDITGGKYVKIISGGLFQVNSTNFEIDSANKFMRCGDWYLDEKGMHRYDYYMGNYLVSDLPTSLSVRMYTDIFATVWQICENGNVKSEVGMQFSYDINTYEWDNSFYADNFGSKKGISIGKNGNIRYLGTKNNSNLIRFVDNTVDQYGNGIVIGDGGLVVVGAGESAQQILDNAGVAGGTETLYLASDGGAYILTNVNNGYSSRKEFIFSSGGRLTVPNELYLGSQNMAEAVKSISRSGTTFTATRCNGQTFTFSQQDNNTWRGYQVKNYNVQYTVNAGAYKDITANDFGASTPSGYTPVAVSLFNPGNDKCWTAAIRADATGTTPMMTVHNPTSGNLTNHAYISILYLQTGSP